MKPLFLFLFIFSMGMTSFSQSLFSTKTLDNSLILKTLFDCKELDSRNEAVWNPDFYDIYRILPISDDKKCHTSIDTVMYFTSKNVKYALFIFGTHEYSLNERVIMPFSYPHTSLAIFKYNDSSNWELKKFDKYFSRSDSFEFDVLSLSSFTKNVSISIIEIGKDNFVLSFHSKPTGGQGYLEGYLTYYSLNDLSYFQNILSVMDYFSNEAAVESSEAYTEEMNQVPIVFSKSPYSDIEFIVKRDNLIKSHKITYRYSEKIGRYVRDTE